MSTLVDGIAKLLAAVETGWDYATDRALDPAKTPVVVASMLAEGDTAVTLTTYAGGPEPDSRNRWEYPRLQVRVRARDPLAALDLDRAAYSILQGLSRVTLPGNAWWLQDCHAMQSEAAPLGQDANGRSEFSRNYQLTAWPTTDELAPFPTGDEDFFQGEGPPPAFIDGAGPGDTYLDVLTGDIYVLE